MPNKVPLARRCDFEFAVEVSILNHLNPEVLSDSVGTGLEVHWVYGLQEVVERLSANGVDCIVLVGGVKDHIEFSRVKPIDKVQACFEWHPDVDKYNVGATISNGVIPNSGVWGLINYPNKRTVTFNLAVQHFTGGRFIINDDGIELSIHWQTIWLRHVRGVSHKATKSNIRIGLAKMQIRRR